MAYLTGSPVEDVLVLVDPAGAPILGASFAVVAASRPNGSSFGVAVAERGGGEYLVSFLPPADQPGPWSLTLRYDGPPEQLFEETYDVDTPAEAGGGVALAPGGATRAELRRRVADLLGDLLVLTATEAAGNPATVVDANALTYQPGILAGQEAVVVAGSAANLGRVRRVAGNSLDRRSLSFAEPLPEPLAVGDRVELYNERTTGWTVDEYHRAIAAVLGDVANLALVPVAAAGLAPDGLGAVAVPAGWRVVSGVDAADARGAWRDLPPSWWRVDAALGAVVVADGGRRWSRGPVRLRGYAHPAPLSADADATAVDAEYVVLAAASRLQLARAKRDGDSGAERRANFFAQRAEQFRGRLRTRLDGTPRRVA